MKPITRSAVVALCGLVSAPAQDLFDPLAGLFDPPPRQDNGIQGHNVRSATSDDGLKWTVDAGTRLTSASVPCAINDGDQRVLIYYVKPPDGRVTHTENTACAVSEDGITFMAAPDFKIESMRTMKACDPAVIRDDAGKFRLYYFGSDFHGDPARAEGPHSIALATSDDGIHYRETDEVISREELCDPDVFRVGREWFMFVHGQGGTVIARSDDGLKFRYQGVLPLRGWATTMPVKLDDGRLRLYAFEQKPGSNIVGSFISTDGLNWTQEPGARLTADTDMQITDPFVIRWRGKWKMYFKTHATPTPPPGRGGPQGFADPGQGFNQPMQSQRPMQPPQNQSGPWNNDVLVYRAQTDGTTEQIGKFDRAGVPTLARLPDGRLVAAFQHFPSDDERNFDRVAVSFSSDEGKTWTKPEPIAVEGLEEGLVRPFDPTLVPLQDGGLRMYFTSNRHRDFRMSTPQIYSAISKDGVHYTFEPGVRFGVEGRIVIDCAVVLHQGVFHLYSPDNGTAHEFQNSQDRHEPPRAGSAYHATSTDGLHFTRADDVSVGDDSHWLGNAQSDGKTITFFGTGRGVFTATSADGTKWQPSGRFAVQGADPGAVAAKDGGWIVLVTGPPRNQTTRFDQEPQPQRFEPRQQQGRGFEPREPREQRPMRVEKIESKYAVAEKGDAGRFTTGQAADVMLGGFGFNQSGGALALNHPTGLATDGKRLLVADRWNNRVLIWTEVPSSNTPPQLVLGQKSFDTNDPGREMHMLNWPGNVAIGKNGQIAVTDTNNDRVLLWNAFPTQSGQRADIVLNLEALGSHEDRMRAGWPWGVWTDGRKLAVVATHGSCVLLWNAWPQRDDTPPDFVLRPQNAGTPRNITSDGTFLMLSDHNYRGVTRPGPPSQNNNGGMSGGPATAVWNTWPTRSDQAPDFHWREWCKGCATPGGDLVLAGIQSVFIWNKRPLHPETDPDVMLTPQGYRNGDGPDAVIAGGCLFVCNYNGCNVLAWNSIPQRDNTPPDFALGSETPAEDVLAKRFHIQNPIVATNGTSLFVSSDFDRKLFVWKQLPAESGARPDLVYHLTDGPWDNALHGSTLVLGGRDALTIWKTLPLDGQPPEVTMRRRIGSIELREITGVALDDQHLYVADRQANKVYVWRGIPNEHDDPQFVLDVQKPGRMSSDGTWLTIAPFEGQEITFFKVANLAQRQPEGWLGGRGMFNLPGKAIISHGRLFVANTSFNRVDVWHDVNDAIHGAPADAHLGASTAKDRQPGIGRAKLFMPGSLAYDGARLWVGEFKFSTRILRFSPSEKASANTPAPHRETVVTDWGALWSQGRAQGTGTVRFMHPPMRVADIERVVPCGMMAGGHVCPIDHGYFFPKAGVTAEVMVPADGFIVLIAHRTQLRGSTERQRDYDDYALTIEHSGTFYTLYDLISALDEAILRQLDAAVRSRFAGKQPNPPLHMRIPVKAGQILGMVKGRSLDFSVVNTQTRLPGFLHPEIYGHYAWRAHMADMFDFFDGDLKSQLLALNVRKTPPFGGKIDFDIARHLSGNWFRENSGGYAGDRSDPRGYWMGHLAFVRHHIDPARIIISIGDFKGRPRQFAILGNSPDPEKITAKDGVVKFELVHAPLDNLGREIELPSEMRGVRGVALAQVLEGERLRLEVFPGVGGEHVKGFTSSARTYER